MTRVNGMVYSVLGLVFCFLWGVPAAAQVETGGTAGADNLTTDVTVDPSSLEFTITCSETVWDTVCVTTPPSGIINDADILFIMDITGSMADELDTVKVYVKQIMRDIIALGIDAQFGVGTIADYPALYSSCDYINKVYGYADDGDFAWHKDQELTPDTNLIQAAIDALMPMNGVDRPEDYSRALYETMAYNYRPDATRIVLMFGDAPVHDCDFLPVSYGDDPGPDEDITTTADNLDYETVVAAVAAAGITVLSLDSSGEGPYGTGPTLTALDEGMDALPQTGGRTLVNSGAWDNFEYMAVQTGGVHFLLSEASQIPDAILQLIGEVAVIHAMSLSVAPEDDPPYGPWVQVLPDSHFNVQADTTVCFEVRVTAVPGPPAIHNFDILVIGDGIPLATIPVSVTVTGASAVKETSWGNLRRMFRSADD